MDKEYKLYPDIAPVASNYSRAVRVGNMFFIAGCTASGSSAEFESFPNQLRETLGRIKAIMEQEGQTMNDVVKLTTFVTDIDGWAENRDEGYFRGDVPGEVPRKYPYPRFSINPSNPDGGD